MPSAILTAQLRKSRVEVLSARTETSSTFVDAKGSVIVEQSLAPVRARRGESWVPLDLDLTDAGTVLRPAAGAVNVEVHKGGTARLATISRGQESLELGWPHKLPAPTVSGRVASYGLNADTELQVATTATGVEQFLVLKRRPMTPPVIRLPLTLRGLILQP